MSNEKYEIIVYTTGHITTLGVPYEGERAKEKAWYLAAQLAQKGFVKPLDDGVDDWLIVFPHQIERAEIRVVVEENGEEEAEAVPERQVETV